jgi:hypothetical protein
MTFKLICLGAAAALVIAPATFAATSPAIGAQSQMPAQATPQSPTAPTTTDTTPAAPDQTVDPSANVGSAANANATVGGPAPDASGATTAKKKTKHGAVNGSTPSGSMSNGTQAPADATTPAPSSTAPAAPQ